MESDVEEDDNRFVETMPTNVYSLSFKVDDFEKNYILSTRRDTEQWAIKLFEKKDAWEIARISLATQSGGVYLQVFIDNLVEINADFGLDSTKIETDRFGSLQINYGIDVGKFLNLGVIVNEKEYFVLLTEVTGSGSYLRLTILETSHALEIDYPDLSKFEIQHCQTSSSEGFRCTEENVGERFSIIPTGLLHPWLSHRAEFFSNGETTELWSFSLIENEGDFKFSVWLYVAEANVHVKWDGMSSESDRKALTFTAEFTGESFESITVATDHTFQSENPIMVSEISITQGGYVYFYEKSRVNHEKDLYTTIEAATQIANGEVISSSLDVRETESQTGLPKFTYTLSNDKFYQPWILEHVIGGDIILVKLDTQMTSEFGFNGDLDCNFASDKKCALKTWLRDSSEDAEFNSRLRMVLETSTETLFFHLQDLENESEPVDLFKAEIIASDDKLQSLNMKALAMKYKDYHSDYYLSSDFSDIIEIQIHQTGDENIEKVFYFRENSDKFEMQFLPVLEIMGFGFLDTSRYPGKNEMNKIEFGENMLKMEQWDGSHSIVVDFGHLANIYQIVITSPTLQQVPDINLKMIPVHQVPLFQLYGDGTKIMLSINVPEELPSRIESLAGQNFKFFSLESESAEIDSAIGIDLKDFSKGSYQFYSKYHQAGSKFDFEQSFEHGLIKASLAIADADGNIENGNGNFNLRYGQDDEGVTKGKFQKKN